MIQALSAAVRQRKKMDDQAESQSSAATLFFRNELTPAAALASSAAIGLFSARPDPRRTDGLTDPDEYSFFCSRNL
jgi:hypothetical protein